MNRRKFLKHLSALGMGLSMPNALTHAMSDSLDHFWVTINAGGGWDPTMIIDPKGNTPRSDGRGPINKYSVNAIESAGNIPFASEYPDGIDPPEAGDPGHFANFFPNHASRLLVINGIDTQTNNHDAGNRFIWSGKIEAGYPSFTALAAANSARDQALSFISNGGYDYTGSLVAPARMGDADAFAKLAYPNAALPRGEEGEKEEYFSSLVYERIQAARSGRLQRLLTDASLPLHQKQLADLIVARNGSAKMELWVNHLPETISTGLRGQAEVAVAAFAAGAAVSANLNISGFDTHGLNDYYQSRQLTSLLGGIDHLWEQVQRHGLEDKVTVLVGSDFGRTPFYNNEQGKDHWNVTSMMAMGAGVRGNRVVGSTNSLMEAEKINPTTLSPDPDGIILTPEHIHIALRTMASMRTSLNQQYEISETYVDLFS